MDNKRIGFTAEYAELLRRVQIECCDALRVIKSRDVSDSFFYCDPPYVGADQGHYDGYTQEDFDMLLEVLAQIKGKFLLSSYRNKSLTEYIRRSGWYTEEISMVSSMSHRYKIRKKVEVLTANYPLLIRLDKNEKKEVVNGEEDTGIMEV
ncbi:MAG: DNA adenine methylase [Spirochaetaceae bacterium]|jgi:DNA adenine methylase|nr:DNA adenine methylase [Spirochaetaceae bacterium]